MPTYTADFRTDAEYATRAFKARSPHNALKKACAFYDQRTEELVFKSYDNGQPVNEIAVRDSDGNQVALWQDDEFCGIVSLLSKASAPERGMDRA